MSATLKVPNFEPINIAEQTTLNAAAAVGDSTVTLTSVEGIAVNDLLYLPSAPNETAEKVKVQSISGMVATITTTLLFAHVLGETVTKVFGDQIKFYRAAAPADGTQPDDSLFTLITGGTVDIDPDLLETTFIDASGSSSFWYKFTHYNSVSGYETAIASSTAARGADYGHYCSVDDIRLEAGFQGNYAIPDSIINSYRIRAEAEVNGMVAQSYKLPFTATPFLVEYATMKLAAGYLLVREYGPYQQGENKEGLGKISEARALLNRIADRVIVLVDAMDNILVEDQVIGGWPDDSTAAASTITQAGGDYQFDTNTKY